MARASVSLIAVAWLLAANQAMAGPIATAGDGSSELASIGGLLQALGAGVIGNGALLYPTSAASHQRDESEILASDTATRVFKKVKSILKDGGLNEDENGDDESKSVTYLIKPAMIFHKEELPPPNPLAGNVLPLPGGALMYTPSPTAAANGEPTSGPAASIKAAYGNLFAASPYFPSYTLNKPHAAVIVEEITDMISLKSAQQRLGEVGEEDEDSDDDEDEFGRKRKGKKPMKIISLETIDSSSTFINPFTRPDFPFGIMTPQAAPTPTPEAKNSRKTIKKTLSKQTATEDHVRASVGKDGGITVINNQPVTTAQGTTIVIPAASLQATSTSGAAAASSSSSSAALAESSRSESAASSSSSAAHEESASSHDEDLHPNEVTRVAHGHKASESGKGYAASATHAKGVRREAATSYDPLAAETPTGGAMADLANIAAETEVRDMASPTVTVGSTTSHAEAAQTESAKRRKMRIVRVYEVKKNKSATATVSVEKTITDLYKRDFMPVYDSTAYVASPGHMQKGGDNDADEDADGDFDMDGASEAEQSEGPASDAASDAALDGASPATRAESNGSSTMSAESSSASPVSTTAAAQTAAAAKKEKSASEAAVPSPAEASSSTAAAEAVAAETTGTKDADAARSTVSKALSIETIGAAGSTISNEEAAATATVQTTASPDAKSAESSASKDEKSADSDDSDEDSESDSDDEPASGKGKERDSEEEDDDDESESDNESKKPKEDDTKAKGKSRMSLVVRSRDDPMAAIQRVAALGMREAEKAVMDYEQHSDVGNIEVLTTDDARPNLDASTSAILSPSASSIERAAKASPRPERATSAKDGAADLDREAVARPAKPARRPRKDRDSDSDSDTDDDDSDSDTDDDEDGKGKKRRPHSSTKTSAPSKETGAAADRAANKDAGMNMSVDVSPASEPVSPASSSSTLAEKKVAATKKDDNDAEARKALSEAAAESARQAAEIETTHIEAAMSEAESGFNHGSGIERGAMASLFNHEDDDDDVSASGAAVASGRAASGASEDDYEFETDASANSDGEEVELLTKIMSDAAAKKSKVVESPSIVVMASIDEEYEEEFFSDSHTSVHKSTARTTTFEKAAPSVTRVQRNAVDDDNDGADEKAVRGAEPTPDVSVLRESQNRAINIGMGNLRRHV
ncbi:hypothetical protein H4R18_001387 [Coemansia javaensis]|uniref:Uncharacterized protein n=1 Tax=Coemansia javaensis TaxID=2761396 RepID=A0A9W8HLN9_9FUNG|nr:hypothetical protein H4R18_001387 [Coemansia javaensis]